MSDGVHGSGGQEVIEEFARKLRAAPPGARLVQQERFTRLHLSNFGRSVAELKAVLEQLGHYRGAKDDVFTLEFSVAIAEFQHAHGLAPIDGIFGPACMEKLLEIARARG